MRSDFLKQCSSCGIVDTLTDFQDRIFDLPDFLAKRNSSGKLCNPILLWPSVSIIRFGTVAIFNVQYVHVVSYRCKLKLVGF